MGKLFGYAGKMLFIDLGSRHVEERKLTEELARTFLGGYGLGAKVLYEMMPPGLDPFHGDSVIGFLAGPCTGTGATMSGRYTVVCKSPVTQRWNDSNSGGYFGPELKKAGYDAVFIHGVAEMPVYIWIHDGKVEIRDAAQLWGKSIKETEARLRAELGEPRMQSAAIGRAGENRSYMATIMNDEHRACGRGGSGAVMGSKNLKAVVVRGAAKLAIANPEDFNQLNQQYARFLSDPPETKRGNALRQFGQYGTSRLNGANILNGESPVKNWGGSGIQDIGMEAAEKLSGVYFDKFYNVKRYGCSACSLRCGAHYEVEEGAYFTGPTDRPEYETIASFGQNCLVTDMDVILKVNEMSNEGGIDTISAGSTIAWAMECYEHGLLTKEDLDGLDLSWGNGEALIDLLDLMIQGKGIGRILMNGQKYAISYLGRGQQFETTAQGIEPGMHDSRRSKGYNRIYQFDPTPGRHMKGGDAWSPLDEPDRPRKDVEMMTKVEVLNCAGFCSFSSSGFDKDTVNRFISATTGWDFDFEEQLKTGKRIFFMRHLFNLREGTDRKELTLSPRLNGPLDEGPLTGVVIPTESMGDDFYSELGWDLDTLIPPKSFLDEIGGFEFAYDFLYDR